MNVNWDNSAACLHVDPPKKPKKLTGTRFASVLGLDRWSSPFKTWCAITRTYEEPFVDSKYTIAGKAIEPKVIDYLNKTYFFNALKTPTDIYGKDYFRKTWGDFFPQEPIFGGMWDALLFEKGKPVAVIEIKTTKRAEDWEGGAPDNYALQASLYAYLLGVEEVVMVASFLEEKDYERPEDFIPSAANTITDSFKIQERFPHFKENIAWAENWWKDYVLTGISPPFDEKTDEAILKELRKNSVSADDDLNALLQEAEVLKGQIARFAPMEKRLKEINDIVKSHCMNLFRDGDTKVAVKGSLYEWILSKSNSSELDKTALQRDGLLEKYTKTKEGYRLTQTLIKEEK